MTETEFTLELLTLLMVYRRETGERPHPVLAGGDQHIPVPQRDRVRDLLEAELNQLGLADDGELVPEIKYVLDVLRHAQLELFGWVQQHELRHGILAAAVGPDALLVTRSGTDVTLRPMRVTGQDDLSAWLVHALPEWAGAEFTPFSVPADRITGGDEGGPDDDARRLRELFALPRTGGGQLHATRRDDEGHRNRVPRVLDYVDTTSGRVLTYVDGESAEGTLHVLPGKPDTLREQLAGLPSTGTVPAPP